MQSEYPYHPLRHMEPSRIRSASGLHLHQSLESTSYGPTLLDLQNEFPKNRHGYPHLSLIQPVIIVDILRTYLS